MNTMGKVTLHILLMVVLLLSTLGSIVMPGTPALADGLTVTRDFDLPEPPSPPQVQPGETFAVDIQFTAPADEFNAIVLHEIAPAGWQVTIDKDWCVPEALTASLIGENGLEYSWLGPYDSGVNMSASHCWDKGDFEIRVKAKDIAGEESLWSDPFPISMPRSKFLVTIFDFLLFEFFPIFKHIFLFFIDLFEPVIY